MNDAQGPINVNDPLWLAWRAYQQTDEFKNSERWAQYFDVVHVDMAERPGVQSNVIVTPYLQGSLWAVFSAGYAKGKEYAHAEKTPAAAEAEVSQESSAAPAAPGEGTT